MHQAQHPRRPAQRHVKLSAVPVVGLGVVEFQRLLQGFVDLGQVRAVGVAGVDDRGRHRRRLQRLADQIHLDEFAGGQLCDGVAGVLPVLDQSLGGEGLEALPHRDVADAEHLGDLADGDRGAGRYGAVEDHPAQLVDDAHGVPADGRLEQRGGVSAIRHPAIFLLPRVAGDPKTFHH